MDKLVELLGGNVQSALLARAIAYNGASLVDYSNGEKWIVEGGIDVAKKYSKLIGLFSEGKALKLS